MNYLVTGCAGFIGYHTCKKLLDQGHTVVGIDNLNDYYDVYLKYHRLGLLKGNFNFYKGSIYPIDLEYLITQKKITRIIHLAAQAGVRYSLMNPDAYVDSNIIGFQSVIEAVKKYQIKHFVYASSSSVYGSNQSPFVETMSCNDPLSFYAATKLTNELTAKAYQNMHGVPSIGLRFFTVYGPLGRPDMAFSKFIDGIKNGKPIQVFNHGDMIRDFTYIDDITDGIIAAVNQPNDYARIYNLGRGEPVNLMDAIEIIAQKIGKPAILDFQGMQTGDVPSTVANIELARAELGYRPTISIGDGIDRILAV